MPNVFEWPQSLCSQPTGLTSVIVAWTHDENALFLSLVQKQTFPIQKEQNSTNVHISSCDRLEFPVYSYTL